MRRQYDSDELAVPLRNHSGKISPYQVARKTAGAAAGREVGPVTRIPDDDDVEHQARNRSNHLQQLHPSTRPSSLRTSRTAIVRVWTPKLRPPPLEKVNIGDLLVNYPSTGTMYVFLLSHGPWSWFSARNFSYITKAMSIWQDPRWKSPAALVCLRTTCFFVQMSPVPKSPFPICKSAEFSSREKSFQLFGEQTTSNVSKS